MTLHGFTGLFNRDSWNIYFFYEGDLKSDVWHRKDYIFAKTVLERVVLEYLDITLPIQNVITGSDQKSHLF